MSLFANLFGSRPKSSTPKPTGADLQDQALIREDIGRLDKVAPGLGAKVVSYICRGENDSVLLILDQHKQKVTTQLRDRSWSSAGRWTPGRSDFLLAASAWRPKAVRRYGEVLAPHWEGSTWPALPGSDRSPAWFRTLLLHYGESRLAILSTENWTVRPSPRAKLPWTIAQVKELLGDDLTPILDAAFERDSGYSYRVATDHQYPEHMPGFEAHLREDPALRVSELRRLSAKGRSYGLRTLARLGLVEGDYFDFAFGQAGDSAKSVREAATLALRTTPSAVLVEKARTAWPTLKQAQKIEIAHIVMATGGEEAAALLKGFLEDEKNDTVRADLSRLLGQDGLGLEATGGQADGAEGYAALDGEWIASPPPGPLPPETPVTPALRASIGKVLGLWGEEAEQHNRQNSGQKYFYRQAVPPSSAVDQVCAVLDGRERGGANQFVQGLFSPWTLIKSRAAAHAELLNHPDLTLWHLSRTSFALRDNQFQIVTIFHDTPGARARRARLGESQDIRVYIDVIARLGVPADEMIRLLLGDSYWRPDFDDWSPDAFWPYFAAHFDRIDEALGLAPPSGGERLVEARAIELLAQFPKTPARYVPALLDRALGDRKLIRQPARELLAAAPGLDQILIPLLKHPKSETRAGAAAWLAERGATEAIEPVLAAARTEKSPAAKAAMLAAVSRLGGQIGEFVSAGALLGEAEEGLKKAPTKGLEWFPFEGLPAVKQANGAYLDPKVLRWWIVLAAKLKQPGSNPWFELLLDQLEPADAAKLGLAVMQAWIAYDTAAPSDAEANAYAAQNVDAQWSGWKRWQPEVTREQVFSMLRQQKLKSYFNSGNDQKGVLALAARAPGAEAVNTVRAYLRDHYTRTAQCKALLECLAANPSPVAIQFVLTISKRWRTRGVQELAGELVAGIAERRGWTADQLADRTIPTGGFDDEGVLELPVGERPYTAKLDAEGKVTLFNPDGKPVQGLPASAAGDAAASLKESKAALASARKELKQVFEFQARRLYEALCVGRDWPAEEWAEFLLRHPVMGRLVQRLVWLGLDEAGTVVAAFRPMEDLTLTDSADATVDPARFSRVRLAHRTALSPEEQAAWQAHLKDYEVAPLFDQFGRPAMTIEALERDATEITDRKGWMIESFKLRGVATKLGYTRGQAEDGGSFYTYEKAFDALGLVAVVEFTGSFLPEENRTSALIALRFVKASKGWLRWNTGVPLSKVPQVLLSEAWNDFHAMADAGAGFDAEWEKTAAW